MVVSKISLRIAELEMLIKKREKDYGNDSLTRIAKESLKFNKRLLEYILTPTAKYKKA